MNKIRLISVHLKYRLNVKSILFLLGIFVMLCLNFIYNTRFYEPKTVQYLYYEEYALAYRNDSFFFLGIIFVVVAVFLPLILEKNYEDLYLAFVSRTFFIFSEVISGLIFLFVFLIFSMSLFYFLSSLLMPYVLLKGTIPFFINLFLEGSLFFVIGTLLRRSFNHPLVNIFLFIYYWFLRIINDDYLYQGATPFIKFFQFLSPILIYDEKKYFFLYGPWYVIINMVLWFFLLVLIYKRKSI